MVPLIDKLAIRTNHTNKPKINKFIQLVEGEANIKREESTNDTDRSYFALIATLSQDDEVNFKSAYANFSKRTPSQNPWVFDNFMIFVLILGICKYNIDQNWINAVLTKRDNENQSLRTINQTFKSLLNGNCESTDNLFEIVVVFLDYLNHPQLPNLVLNSTFRKLSTNQTLLQSRDEFVLVISLRAHDVIVLASGTLDNNEVANLKRFKTIFLRKVKWMVNVIYWIIFIGLMLLMLKYYRAFEGLRDYINDVGAIFQIAGFALLAGFSKWTRKKIRSLLLLLSGYTKAFRINQKDE